jgi:hypothetical protein
MERSPLGLRPLCFLGIGALILLSPCRGAADVLGHFTGLYHAATLSTGQLEGAVSFAAVHNEGIAFFHSGQNRVSLPRLYGAYRIGRQAFVEGSWDYRIVDDHRTGAANGSGDVRLATQVEIAPHAWPAAAIAARAAVKIPNADENLSLGTNETDVIGLIVVTRTLTERWDLLLQVGVEILGDPREAAVQDDVLDAGLGVDIHIGSWTTRLGFVAQEGRNNGNNAQRVVWATRGPISRRVSWVVGAEAGLAGLASDWGVQAGIVVTNIAGGLWP